MSGDATSRIGVWSLAWRLARTHPRLYAASMILWIGFHSLPLTTGFATRVLFDRLQLGQDLEVAFAALAACELVRLAVMYGASIAWGANYTIFIAVMRVNLLDWIVRERGPALTTRTTGEQVSRFRDDPEHFTDLLDTWLDVAGTSTFTVIGLVVLARVDVALTAIVIAPLSLIALSTRFFGERMKEYRRAASRATARVTGFVGEVFGAVQAIKVGGAEPAVLRHLRALGDDRRRASVRDRLASELMNAFGLNSLHLAIGLVMLLGAAKLRSGQLTVGELSLFFSYVSGMAWCPRFLGHLLYRKRYAAVAADRMVRTLDGAPPETLVAPTSLYLAVGTAPPPVPSRRRTARHRLRSLEADGVTHLFPSSHHGVHDVSFSVPGGSFTVITGPVGSGKTTLLRVLLGLLPDHDGVVRWNGKPIEDRGHFLVPPRAAYTAQVPRLFSDAIADNVLLGRPDDGRLERAMWRAVLEDDIADMEHGAATVIGPRGVRLSGGQVQRVAAARMFAQDASLLVFDDLSSALDVDTEHQLWERLLGDRDEQTTCLVVSHRPAVLRRADQIIVLDEGRAVATGTYRQVRATVERALPQLTA